MLTNSIAICTKVMGKRIRAAATASLSGEQKMAVALSAFNTVYTQYAQSIGVPVEPANVQAFLQKAFDLLDTLPSAVVAPVTATTATPAPTTTA